MYKGEIGDKTYYGALTFDDNGTPYICYNEDGVFHRERVNHAAKYLGFADKNGKDVFNCDKVELIYSTSYDEERIKLVGFARCDYLGTYVFVPVEEGSDMGHAYYLCKVYGLGVKYVNGVPWVGAVTLLQ